MRTRLLVSVINVLVGLLEMRWDKHHLESSSGLCGFQAAEEADPVHTRGHGASVSSLTGCPKSLWVQRGVTVPQREAGHWKSEGIARGKKNGRLNFQCVSSNHLTWEQRLYDNHQNREKNTELSVTDNMVNACGTVSSHDRLPEMKPHSG